MTFLLFVRPFVTALQGETPKPLLGFPVAAGFTRPRPDRRREFVRAQLARRPDGQLEARAYPRQGSGVLSSTTWADGLVDIDAGITVAMGDSVRFLPFTGLLS